MTELKTKVNKASVAAFIRKVPDERKRKDSLALLKLFKSITGKQPKMWGETVPEHRRKGAGASAPSRGRAKSQQRLMGGRGIVGFGQYHYKSERSSQEGDWPLTGFSSRKQNLTLYVMSGFSDQTALLKKLGKYKKSVGCLYINTLDDVDMTVLKQLIKKSYLAMKKRYHA